MCARISTSHQAKTPAFRQLRGYAFDPSLSLKIDTAFINNIVYKIPWETGLEPGPVGEYVEVIDYDPTVKKFYMPVEPNDHYILAQNGLEPSESNPLFHQQMVYAVVMTTIKNFESALGRQILWSPHTVRKKTTAKEGEKARREDRYVPRLRIYPHAFRDANAYYSPQKKALLFGYFSARPADITLQMPNALVFTCLSHDIIAHETTHAIIDGLFRKYTDATNPDVLAFHEAFADMVALFQHFTFPDVLKNQISKTRGNLAAQNLLGQLAQEFGTAIGRYGALRDAIGYIDETNKEWKPIKPTGEEYATAMEPHSRGAILVSAVFEAFLAIYKSRIADLLRIATGGSGILPQGELHPDLVNRLASEAAKTAGHVLKMCIRSLDYCPPVDIGFGDYLRALITADLDLVPDDDRDYRLAFIDAFRNRGIYPSGIKNLSVESLSYAVTAGDELREPFAVITTFLRDFSNEIIYTKNREDIFVITRKYITGSYDTRQRIFGLHRRFGGKFLDSIPFQLLTGLVFTKDWSELGIATSGAYGKNGPSFEIHSLKLASRVGPDGNQSSQIIISLTQRAGVQVTKDTRGTVRIKTFVPGEGTALPAQGFLLTGGCTLIFDLDSLDLKYAITKPLLDIEALKKGIYRINRERALAIYNYCYGKDKGQNAYEAYFGPGKQRSTGEPFFFLHNE